MQITVEKKDQKKFVSLSTSIIERESVLNDISYLHSPQSKHEWCRIA